MNNRPIDLIVANVMHDAAGFDPLIDKILHVAEQFRPDLKKSLKKDLDASFYDDVARRLLCMIANEAKIADVHKALAAVGAPASAEMIGEGVQAVRDRQGAS